MHALILAVTIAVGDPGFRPAHIKPYRNAWTLSYAKPGGQPKDAAVWTDTVTESKEHGKRILRRIQVATYIGKPMVITTENIVDATTLEPLKRKYDRTDGVHHYIDFDGRRARYERVSTPGDQPVRGETVLERRVFDFYGGMYGLLIAALPLRVGLTATLPSIDEDKEQLRWATYNVVRKERIDVPGGATVDAFVVQVEDSGLMTFWLTQQPPYVIKLVYEMKQGVTATYTMRAL